MNFNFLNRSYVIKVLILEEVKLDYLGWRMHSQDHSPTGKINYMLKNLDFQ